MLKQFPSILIFWGSVYVRQKYIDLAEISIIVLETQKAEFGDFTIPVNNTLECCASFVFLVADVRPCVLITFN